MARFFLIGLKSIIGLGVVLPSAYSLQCFGEEQQPAYHKPPEMVTLGEAPTAPATDLPKPTSPRKKTRSSTPVRRQKPTPDSTATPTVTETPTPSITPEEAPTAPATDLPKPTSPRKKTRSSTPVRRSKPTPDSTATPTVTETPTPSVIPRETATPEPAARETSNPRTTPAEQSLPESPKKFYGLMQRYPRSLEKKMFQFKLMWTPSVSADVVAYHIYKDGKLIKSIPASKKLYLRSLRHKPTVKRKYTICAVDRKGVESRRKHLKIWYQKGLG